MADFSQSLTFEVTLHKVNAVTWADGGPLGNVNSVSVTRSKGAMIEGATVSADLPLGEDFEEGYYRVVMRTTQNDTSERHEVATLYCTAVSGSVIDDGTSATSIEGKSVLYPANEVTIELGAYVSRGSDGAAYVARMLGDVIAAPVVTDGSFFLADDYVFDIGEKVLSAAWKILDAAGWCMQISGDGTVTIMPIPSESQAKIRPRDIVANNFTYSSALQSIPNRYIAFDGMNVAECRNDDPESVASIPTRGFVKDIDSGVDTSPVLVQGESLAAYCRRKLIEASAMAYQQTYTREYDDVIRPYSMISMPAYGYGDYDEFTVVSQTLDVSGGLSISETCERRVPLWQG